MIADADWDAGDFWLTGVYLIVIALGAMGGAFFAPQGRKLIEIADRDIATAGDGEVAWSPEYHAVQKGLARGGTVANLLVLIANLPDDDQARPVASPPSWSARSS